MSMFVTKSSAMAVTRDNSLEFDDKLEPRKSSMDDTLMSNRPMYAEFQSMKVTCAGDFSEIPLYAPSPDLARTPSTINTDTMTGITMISGKPLSGRVLVGDARVIRNDIQSEHVKYSPKKDKAKATHNRSMTSTAVLETLNIHKSSGKNNRSNYSKLHLLDKITSERSSGITTQTTISGDDRELDSKSEENIPGDTRQHATSLDQMKEEVRLNHSQSFGRESYGFCTLDGGLHSVLSEDRTLQPSAAEPISTQTEYDARMVHVVHWFRKGLRLHDNPALKESIKGCTTFRCIYILDPWFAGSSNVGMNKWRFLLQSLTDLDNSLRRMNSRLFVVRGQPANVLPILFKKWQTNVLSFEEDPEPFGKARDASIVTIAQTMAITTIVRTSHTLYDLKRILEQKGGKTPLTYKTFQNILMTIGLPPAPVEEVSRMDLQGTKNHSVTEEDHDEKYGVPNLEDLGFETSGLTPNVWKGGETEALCRLKHLLERKAWVASFGIPKMSPHSLYACPTGLSPYLRFGCLSPRKFYYELNKLYMEIKKAPAPVSLHGQLLWREFFYTAATNNPNFDRMKGNPICLQIPWDKNAEALAKWAHGQTGFPWIDAIMTQLRKEGWIHNVARHAVACFLTRGDLWISWEEGMKVFDELMLDADWSVNAGSWMWLSCSSFFQQFFHCYCPVRYGRKADPNGDFIRTYLPVLKNLPTKYIHEPWMAPETVQKYTKCIIGEHYPLPMVDHIRQSHTNIERMKQVYRQLTQYRNREKSSVEESTGTS